MKKIIILLTAALVVSASKADETGKFCIEHEPTDYSFRLAGDGKASAIYVDSENWKGVIHSVGDLKDDIRKALGIVSETVENVNPAKGSVLIGTISKSKLIDRLIADGKIDIAGVRNKRETFLIQTTGGHLVIAGNDKRGTIFGIYELSRQIGISPWYWWADVPVAHQYNLYVKAGRYTDGEPAVMYRGIFINDEAPAFQGWCVEKFGGVNSRMYGHMFELILRLKGNFQWPAMWGNASYDDPRNDERQSLIQI
jgi:hypothetical protein